MKRLLKVLLTLTFLAALSVGAVYIYATRYFVHPGPLTSAVTVLIAPGTGFEEITAQLEESGVISHQELFMGNVMLQGKQREFKAGEYAFAPQISPKEVADKLIKGDVLVYDITIPEGLTSAEILALLRVEETLTGDLPAFAAEGSLLPETYHYIRGDTRRSVLGRMQKAMTETLASLWQTRRSGLPLSTPEDAVILASIVEKETGIAEERPRVAAVFINRLIEGMKLQSDPTVIYGLWINTGQKPELLLKKHLKTTTPYNTYLIQALPPGPIANPGKASLHAVLNAPQTDEYYFVADGTGGHRFAHTLEEHNANVRYWRQMQSGAE